MGFILPAEKILRKFFGFDKAGATMGALTGFAAGNVMGSLKKIGSGGGKASGGASSSQGAEKPIRYQGKHNAGDLDEKELGKAVGTKEKSKLGNGESEDRYEQFKEELNNPENHQNSNSNEE